MKRFKIIKVSDDTSELENFVNDRNIQILSNTPQVLSVDGDHKNIICVFIIEYLERSKNKEEDILLTSTTPIEKAKLEGLDGILLKYLNELGTRLSYNTPNVVNYNLKFSDFEDDHRIINPATLTSRFKILVSIDRNGEFKLTPYAGDSNDAFMLLSDRAAYVLFYIHRDMLLDHVILSRGGYGGSRIVLESKGIVTVINSNRCPHDNGHTFFRTKIMTFRDHSYITNRRTPASKNIIGKALYIKNSEIRYID